MTDQEKLDTSWELWKKLQESLGQKFIEIEQNDYEQDMEAAILSDIKAVSKPIEPLSNIADGYGVLPTANGLIVERVILKFFEVLSRTVTWDVDAVFIRKNPWVVVDAETGVYSIRVRLHFIEYKKDKEEPKESRIGKTISIENIRDSEWFTTTSTNGAFNFSDREVIEWVKYSSKVTSEVIPGSAFQYNELITIISKPEWVKE